MSDTLVLDWKDEARTLISAGLGVRETARQLGLPEDRVKKWCSRTGLLKKISEARIIVSAVRSPNVPSAEKVMQEMPRTTKVVANSLALRALERLSQKDDDELLSQVTTDVATKWIGNAAKAGQWDTPAPATALVSLSFNSAPLVPLEMVAEAEMDISPIAIAEGHGEAASVDPMDDPAF